MQLESTRASTSRSSTAGFLVAGEPLHPGDHLHLHPNGDFALSTPVPSDRLAVDHSSAGELAALSDPRLTTTAMGPIHQPHVLTCGSHTSGLKHTRARTGSLRWLEAYFPNTPSTWQPCAGWIPPGPAALWPNRPSCTVAFFLFIFCNFSKNSTGLNIHPNEIIPTPIFF